MALLVALAATSTIAGLAAALLVLIAFAVVAPYGPSDVDTPRLVVEGLAAWLAWAITAPLALIAGWRRVRRRARGFWFTRRNATPPSR